uniref:DUF4371 domain-containing protein n=1 Tax=Gossypium raimondii TaxID=29730 RepID=A0A0D2MQU5_GOSRA|nr:hypothetical protein B456_003G052500 [Gossypium raimondii]
MYKYPVNMCEEIRRAYIKNIHLLKMHNPSNHFGSTTFTHSGFSNWKKVHNGCNFVFLTRVGKDLNSLHNNSQHVDLMNQSQYIEVSLDRQTTQQITANRLCLKTRYAFGGYDESSGSKYRGNFLEFLSLLSSYDEKVKDVLKSAPQNASYTSSTIQEEILQIYTSRVCNVIHKEIGDKKLCIIVDEARDDEEQAAEITRLVSINELATRIGMNQIGTLQHLGETRWSSHLNSITILLTMYNATSTILENLKNIAPNHSQRGDAHNTYNRLRSFEFIFILHMIKEVLGVTDNLCQALQRRFQDILNVLSLVSTTKDLIQKLRDDGWDELLKNVIYFCETWELDFPYMNAQYIMDRSHNKKEDVTLKHYELDVCKHPDLRKISTLSELCRSLVESGKSVMYPLFDRLICPLLTFLVSTASAKRVFSAMKIVKTRFCSKMEDDFLRSYLVVYTEKEIPENFNVNKIINGFSEIKDWKVQFKYIL